MEPFEIKKKNSLVTPLINQLVNILDSPLFYLSSDLTSFNYHLLTVSPLTTLKTRFWSGRVPAPQMLVLPWSYIYFEGLRGLADDLPTSALVFVSSSVCPSARGNYLMSKAVHKTFHKLRKLRKAPIDTPLPLSIN